MIQRFQLADGWQYLSLQVDEKIYKISCKIVKGIGKASYFTNLDWVQDQCMEKLGFKPYPGTLNLQVEADDLNVLEKLRKGTFEELIPPDPNFCSAKIHPVSIGAEKGALLIPDEAVRVHGASVVEIIAPKKLKDALEIEDGESLIVVLNNPKK